ncbi:MAG TPA: type II secretion system F family protein, partial [Fimbriimonadaceae bacterium]|nr:type II secretion system F family protein [Fimbriimonadaceae bacterium]
MTTFAYVALEPSGRKKTGYVDANDRQAAIATITSAGNFVLEISEQAGQSSVARAMSRRGKVNRAEIALFTRRLADLSGAGLPLDRVLQVVAEQSESAQLTEVAEEALADVRGGMPVSQALAKHPKLFNEVFTQTLRAGEASGQFPEVTARLADFQEREVARRSQIVSALVYPGVLTGVAVFVVIFLLLFVVPRLSGVFADLGDELPASTVLLLAFTDFLTNNYLLLLGGAAALFFGYRAWSATEAGALVRDRLVLRTPVLGPVIRKAVVSRFSRVLGTLVYGGVPILEAIQIA